MRVRWLLRMGDSFLKSVPRAPAPSAGMRVSGRCVTAWDVGQKSLRSLALDRRPRCPRMRGDRSPLGEGRSSPSLNTRSSVRAKFFQFSPGPESMPGSARRGRGLRGALHELAGDKHRRSIRFTQAPGGRSEGDVKALGMRREVSGVRRDNAGWDRRRERVRPRPVVRGRSTGLISCRACHTCHGGGRRSSREGGG